ncbi:MAG: DUF1634 domain-containing protein [Betaproteobacteria bacterium]|nr:DUF1634 domain-containing protein [Betaproteobacteria bacterium]MDE2622764.1 DUF1634 domain-containing protein [Betaproteobacteria bacterium]
MKDSARMPPEEKRYADVLHWGSLAGFILLVLSFLLYITGTLPPQAPLDQLPRLWKLSTADYLAATHGSGGWHWITTLDKGDSLSLLGIALLSACPIASIAAVIPVYLRQRNHVYAVLCILTVMVLLYAASGMSLFRHS